MLLLTLNFCDCRACRFSTRSIAVHCTDATFDLFQDANERLREANRAAEVERRISQGVATELAKLNELTPEERLVEDAKVHVIDQLLTDKCPNCKTAFVDFEACMVLQCRNCPHYFCACCLCDFGTGQAGPASGWSVGHRHLPHCKDNTTGSIFARPPEKYFEIRHARCKRNVKEYIETLEPNLRELVLDACWDHISELGVQNKQELLPAQDAPEAAAAVKVPPFGKPEDAGDLVSFLRAHSSEPSILAEGLTIVASACRTTQENRDACLQAGILDMLREPLREFMQDAKVAAAGCSVVGNLCTGKQATSMADFPDLVHTITEILKHHVSDTRVVTNACAALGNIAMHPKQDAEAVAVAIPHVLASLNVNFRHSMVALSAVSCLHNLIRRKEGNRQKWRLTIEGRGGVATLVAALIHHRSNAQIAMLAAGVLAVITDGPPPNAGAVRHRHEAIAAIMPMLKHYLNQPKKWAVLATALRNVTRTGPQQQVLCARQGGVVVAAQAMREHRTKPNVQMRGAQILLELTARRNTDNIRQCQNVGAFEIVLRAIHNFSTNASVVWAATGAICNFASAPEFAGVCLHLGAQALIVKAVQNHAMTLKIVQICFMVLQNFAMVPEYREVHGTETCKVAVSLLSLHAGSTSNAVRPICCTMCNLTIGRTPAVIEALVFCGGISSLLEVLMNPAQAASVEPACKALYNIVHNNRERVASCVDMGAIPILTTALQMNIANAPAVDAVCALLLHTVEVDSHLLPLLGPSIHVLNTVASQHNLENPKRLLLLLAALPSPSTAAAPAAAPAAVPDAS